jgi:DNA polymerase III subunit alpha
VVLLPPCVNRSTDRYEGESDTPEVLEAEEKSRHVVSAIRVPLSAIRGLITEAVQHILAMRNTFGPFTSLPDFCRRIEVSVQLCRRRVCPIGGDA